MMPFHNVKATAQTKNITNVELVVEAVNRLGSVAAAAAELNVTRQAIRYHLRKNNLRTQPKAMLIEMENGS